MTKSTLMITVCASLLWTGTAPAAPTSQQQCDYARITAWKTYQACVDTVVAKDAKGVGFDEFAAFARCRHAYFKKWTAFQNPKRKPSLAGSTCREDTPGIGQRFTEPVVADGTVTDNLTGLVWELKDNLDGMSDLSNPHDADNTYTLSTGSGNEDGTVFTSFLATLNGGAGFAGANSWRLTTLAELQTIVLDFPCRGKGLGARCSCPVTSPTPCVDPALDPANTQAYLRWSATSYVPNPLSAWLVNFANANVFSFDKTYTFYVRAVRGGL